MPLRKPRNAHAPPSQAHSSSSPSSPSNNNVFNAIPPSAYAPSSQSNTRGPSDEMFDPFSNAPRPRRKPYSPFSAFEAQQAQQQAQGMNRDSTGSAYSYEAESVEHPPAPAGNNANANANGKHRRSTLSFEIGGAGDETDTDREAPIRAPLRQATMPTPAPAPAVHQTPSSKNEYLVPRHSPDSSPEISPPDSSHSEPEHEAEAEAELVPPRPRFLNDAQRASWSSQDSSLYPSSAPGSDTELVGASDSDREVRGARGVAEREREYVPPVPRQHAYKRRSSSQTRSNSNSNVAPAATAARNLPPGAAAPTSRSAARRYSASRAAAAGAAGAVVGAAGAEVLGEEIERSESPSALMAQGNGARRAPPSAFRGSRTSFSGPPGAVGVGEEHPLSPNPNNGYHDAESSQGHGSFVSASSAAYAHQSPHTMGGGGYQYPPSSGGSPTSPSQGPIPGPIYPGGAGYGPGAGYPGQFPGAPQGQQVYGNMPPSSGGSGYATPVARPPAHNAFMANSAMARSSMSASGSAVDLVPYASRLNGGAGQQQQHPGMHSRRSSADVGGYGFAPPQPPFAQGGGGGGGGYPPPSPGTPELRHAGSVPKLREPFLSPASRRASSVWAPPTPAMYSGNLGYESDGRAGSGFFGGYAYNGVGSGSNTMLALPGKKEPLPSSALRRKISVSEKPWIKQRVKGERASWWLTFLIMWIGIAVGAVICFFGFTNVEKIKSNLCSVLDDDFSSFNTDTWSKNVSLGGFGNGEFQMTTDSSDNLYIKNGQLYIMPTLTSDEIGEDAVLNGHTYDLDGCTETWNASDCSVTSDSSTNTVINPVKSARISTKDSVSIAYGMIEVKAKMPTGDWLWPAIWMLPKDEKYGAWPLSGEIDLVEARGNLPDYPAQGNNFVRSSMNWGPLPSVIASTFGWQTEKRTTYSADFHTYTLEWTSDFMRFSVDSKLHAMLDLNVKKQSFFNRGAFPATSQNGSTQAVVNNIWEGQPNSAPFDQEFYLIIDLAVGGTSGWFPDNDGGKMWFDGSATAMTDFANAQSTWSATWPSSDDERALRIDSVKMWKLC